MDFYQIKERSTKSGVLEVYPDFKVNRTKDLMVRGKSFYAIWDQDAGIWSTDEYDVQRLVDNELYSYAESIRSDGSVYVRSMADFSSNSWINFRKYISHVSDNAKQLDDKLTFSNTEIKKTDYVSKRLPYPLERGDYSAWDELVGTLYDPDERAKIEWAIGSIVAGDAKDIQKFLVLYGEAGAGKSTILNIIQKLFNGYYTMFEAKALASNNNQFSTEAFKSNPLVAIQHDGDLSKIEDNTKLNSIISHEEMLLNEKYKSSYSARINCFLFMATNKPVKITDAKSGIIRRLIDVRPSGRKLEANRYNDLMKQIDFQLGAIAFHCRDVYKKMGKNFYSSYRPIDMMFKTDLFFNFVEDSYDFFNSSDGVTLKAAYSRYKTYCDESGAEYRLPLYKFREELKNYFDHFEIVARIDGKQVRSYYTGFMASKFAIAEKSKEEAPYMLDISSRESIFDKECSSCQAQYARENGTPKKKWDNVNTVLSDIDTTKLHYVKVPENHIVIDFDLKEDDGHKSLKRNLEAASTWPPTYAELSKSGQGIHLHYIYNGDVEKLSRVYEENIEVKVFTGNSSLRRQLTFCNDEQIATISSGLPLKGEKVINFEAVKNEKHLRALIFKNLNKEVHPATKPSVDFIFKMLEDAYNSGMNYDVTDLRPKIQAFARRSTHNSDYCLKLTTKMHYKSEDISQPSSDYKSDDLVFYDVEVFPNLFIVVYKMEGRPPVKMINPTSREIEELIKYKLVGFNCRRYDNHILYGRLIGYDNMQLYNLSQKIINNSRTAMFGEAYNISYTDIYDFSSKKQSLKKFEIELGIHHQELGFEWDKPVPEDQWHIVADYCVNDVVATEETFKARKADWIGRQILAELSGLTVNDTTNSHTTRIIFGTNKKPSLVYTDLASGEQYGPVPDNAPDVINSFPGYEYKQGKNLFRGEDVGKGGYVYAKPGMYFGNIVTFDVESQHPHSIIAMSCFGEYTKRFEDLLHARMYIKHKDFDKARTMLDGKLSPYLDEEDQAKDLAYALKIAINSVYGLTSASFDNPFHDERNKNNIVALRGALFMFTLRDEIIKRGFEVIHIKTDSIKVLNPTEELSKFIFSFAEKYGYRFEIEHVFERICLVNDAVYIAKLSAEDPEDPGKWTATGAQFAHPYVFKTLFSKEALEFEDYCETKSVKSSLYLDMNESLGESETIAEEIKRREFNANIGNTDRDQKPKKLNPIFENMTMEELKSEEAKLHNYHFVGKAGQFVPILPNHGGGVLLRETDGKYFAVTGTKGYRWLEAEVVRDLKKFDSVDKSYGNSLVDAAVDNISNYGDFEQFVSDDYVVLPWE